MAWATSESGKTSWTLEELKAKETSWLPSPISERERWEKDLGTHYELVGEYEIDDDKILLRWKFFRGDDELLRCQCKLYQNVVLSRSMRPYAPFDITFGKKK